MKKLILIALCAVLMLMPVLASAEAMPVPVVTAGDVIAFGAYEQDNDLTNGAEAIEWLVLAVDEENNRALVISVYALDNHPYNDSRVDMTWEKCTLRAWLNDEFLNTAFNEEAQAFIPAVVVKADHNSFYKTETGNDTEDRVFVLSSAEAALYFANDAARACQPTAYALARKVYRGGNHNCWWWLRTPGNSTYNFSRVSGDGEINEFGVYQDHDETGVRPAMWIDLSLTN